MQAANPEDIVDILEGAELIVLHALNLKVIPLGRTQLMDQYNMLIHQTIRNIQPAIQAYYEHPEIQASVNALLDEHAHYYLRAFMQKEAEQYNLSNHQQ